MRAPLFLSLICCLATFSVVVHSHGHHAQTSVNPHHHHHENGHCEHHHDHADHSSHDALGAASSALLATGAVSLLPILILCFIPLLRKDSRTGAQAVNLPLLRALLAFAVGGLVGDALLHLLPHALDQASPRTVGLLMLAGLGCFFLLEKLIRATQSKEPTDLHKKDDDHVHAHGHAHEGDRTAGLLNLVADFSHNWTDGMALAASFMSSPALGLSTTVAIMLHEIPHEVGDYALLVQAGMTHRQALLLQFGTAVGAFSGCVMGLVAGEYIEGFELIVLPFTAGGFLYIALVETVPVLMQGISLTLTQTMIEIFACCVGLGAMLAIALFE